MALAADWQREGGRMAIRHPRHSMQEFARCGNEIYDRSIRAQVEATNKGKFVAIDIETGDWEIDADDYMATERLLTRRPDAQTWLIRIGDRATYRIGGASSRIP